MERPNWDEYFMEIAAVVAKRSICLRRNVGALIVKDNQIISFGYNGAPKGLRQCEETGCLREQLNVPSGKMHELCRAVHAEQNAIVKAAKYGIPIKDTTLYCTHQPCVICAKLIINSGIKRIVYSNPYPDKLAEEMLKESGIEINVI